MTLHCMCGQVRDVAAVYRRPPGVDYRAVICPACMRIYMITGWRYSTGPIITHVATETYVNRKRIYVDINEEYIEANDDHSRIVPRQS
jgi:hypothetical protein